MINRKNVYFVLILLYTPFIAIAHNTNVTHPLLTLEAIRLIKESDDSANKYNELYRTANVDFSEEKYNKIIKELKGSVTNENHSRTCLASVF